MFNDVSLKASLARVSILSVNPFHAEVFSFIKLSIFNNELPKVSYMFVYNS